MLLAQLSDLHIRPRGAPLAFGRIDTNAMAERAIRRVAALDPAPDAVIITGDLTDCGRPEEFALLRDLLGLLPMAVHLVLGNHDRHDSFRETFADWPSLVLDGGDVHCLARWPGLRLIGLDSVVPGESAGGLSPARLAFLASELARDDETPTILAMHHAPLKTGSTFLDRVGLVTGAEELAAILDRYACVRRIIAGHHHRSIEGRFAGVPVSVAPAVVNACHLEIGGTATIRGIAEPPGFKLHLLLDGELVSHTLFVDDFGQPFLADPDPDYPAMTTFQAMVGRGGPSAV